MNDSATDLVGRIGQGKGNGSSEQSDDRSRHKACLGVTFIDAEGKPTGLQYMHYLYAEVDGRDLVLMFSTHKVTLTGRGLFSPVKDCLMARIQNHKEEYVTCIPGGKERDFSQQAGFVVTGIRVEKREKD